MPIIKNNHLLLVTLLLCNAACMEVSQTCMPIKTLLAMAGVAHGLMQRAVQAGEHGCMLAFGMLH